MPGREPSRRRGTTARRAAEQGFTFVELIVVIAVMGLMSAIVVAGLDGMTDNSQVSAAARRLGNDMMRTQNIAQVQGREMSIEIDVEKTRWRIVDRPSPNEVPDPSDREDETFYGSWYSPSYEVHLEELAVGRGDTVTGLFTVTFDQNGELSPSGFVAFFTHENFKNKEDKGISLEVSGLTGLVNYSHGKTESEEVRREEDF